MNSKISQSGMLFVMALVILVLAITLTPASHSRVNRSMQQELSIPRGG